MPIMFASRVAKSSGSSDLPDLIKALRKFVADHQGELSNALMVAWSKQIDAITYREIRDAIKSGSVTLEQIEEWQQEYSKFITENFGPKWEDGMKAAAEQITAKYPDFEFDPGTEAVKAWTEKHSGELVTRVTNQQRDAINTLVRRSASMKDLTVDELSRAIRPVVGLTKPQATANLNYYNSLRQAGMKPEKALDKSVKYAARQHRYRAQNIARTELAMSYNHGEYSGIKQAQEQGYMGPVRKKWMTAGDERVCAVCQEIDGAELPLDSLFPVFGGALTPPAHPSCRCCLIYVEESTPMELPAPAVQ